MDGNYVTVGEHKEFARRQDAENGRQNRRISLLEEEFQKLTTLTVAVEKMAVSMENMLAEQKRQGERLEMLEKEPAETGRQIKLAVVTSVIGTVAGAAVLAFALINQLLAVAGKNPLPFTNEDVGQGVSMALTAAASLWAWRKNNSFTQAAIAADEQLKKPWQ